VRRLIAAALLACGCAHAPESQPAAAPAPAPEAAPAPEKPPPLAPAANDRENQADWAISLFMQSCIANLTKPADLTRWIQEHDLRKVPAELESRILAGQPGEVWSAGNSLGVFLLIVVPIDPRVNQCSIWAQHADAARLNAHFTRLLAGTARPGLLVEEVSDGPIKGPGGEYRQLVYYVHKEGVALGFVFVATTSPSDEAEVQGRLMASPGEGRKIVLPGGLPPDEPDQNEPKK
jgi:hypothetical protein